MGGNCGSWKVTSTLLLEEKRLSGENNKASNDSALAVGNQGIIKEIVKK